MNATKKKNNENFEKLDSEAKELLIKENYDFINDPDDILRITPSSNRNLELKINEIRIKNARKKFNI